MQQDKAYRFCVVIEGRGPNVQAALQRAAEEFGKNPGAVPPFLDTVVLHDTERPAVNVGEEYTEDITEAFQKGTLG